MKTTTNRNFLKLVAVLWLSILLLNPNDLFGQISNDSFAFHSPFMNVVMQKDYPQFNSIWVDALGKNKATENPLITGDKIKRIYRSAISEKSISYQIEGQEKNSLPVWKFKFSEKSIKIISNKSENSDPFNITVDQELNHTTVLGIIKERNKIALPCLIHLPGMGTFRVTSNVSSMELFVDASRKTLNKNLKYSFVSISFPAASNKCPHIIYQLDLVSIYPHVAGIEHDPMYDGFKRDFINIFQINPRLRVLSNNSSSDPCAFTLYSYAQLAQYTPPLANGLNAMDMIKFTLDRYINGMKGYGLVGYTDGYEGAVTSSWNSKYNSLDSHPSLLMSACYYINTTNDTKWLYKNLNSLTDWADIILQNDIDGDGLIESPVSGNSSSWDGFQRPSNWWDCIGFGHKDAYSNALAYLALNMFGEIFKKANLPNWEKYLGKAEKLKSVYFSTFYNPETGVLAGWKSKDGELHDYYFTFVNSMAISYGLINIEQGNLVMDKLLSKMESVGFTDFSLGLPGNLIPIRKADYTTDQHRWGGPSLEDGTDAFQIYENGGATACYTYFTVDALQKLNRNSEADKILHPILKSLSEGNFSGKCSSGMSKDWKNWKGECWGYEGFLVDNYLVLLACLAEDKGFTK